MAVPGSFIGSSMQLMQCIWMSLPNQACRIMPSSLHHCLPSYCGISRASWWPWRPSDLAANLQNGVPLDAELAGGAQHDSPVPLSLALHTPDQCAVHCCCVALGMPGTRQYSQLRLCQHLIAAPIWKQHSDIHGTKLFNLEFARDTA